MTDSLKSRIQQLDDATALSILAVYARNQPGTLESLASPELQAALANLPDTSDPAPMDEAEAARAALSLLADDPATRPIIHALLTGPRPERMDLGITEGALLISGLLFALQTHIRFERDKEGKISMKIEKKPTDTKLLKSLIATLLKLQDKQS